MAPPRTNYKVSANPLAFTELTWHLQQGEYNRDELLELIGVSDGTLRKWLRYLRRPGKRQVYISDRRVKGNIGQPKLYYTWGNEPDAPKLVNKGTAVHSARYRARKLEKETLYGIRNDREQSNQSSSDLS
jgi:hypothetical protein